MCHDGNVFPFRLVLFHSQSYLCVLIVEAVLTLCLTLGMIVIDYKRVIIKSDWYLP